MINSPQFPVLRFPHLSDVQLPSLQRVGVRHRQSPPVDSIEHSVVDALRQSRKINALVANSEVAIAVGSRGIGAIARVVKATVEYLAARGLRPFIVPAMGSSSRSSTTASAEYSSSRNPSSPGRITSAGPGA